MGAPRLRALDRQAPFQGLDPIRKPAQSAATIRVGPADAVVPKFDDDRALGPTDGHLDHRSGGVLGRIGQSLRTQEIDPCLDLRREPGIRMARTTETGLCSASPRTAVARPPARSSVG